MNYPVSSPQPNLDEAALFLQTLFAEDALVTIATKLPRERDLYRPDTRTGPLNQAIDYACSLAKEGRQLYFGVLPRLSAIKPPGTGKKTEIAQGQVVWADVDCYKNEQSPQEILQLLQALPFPPSLVVNSGGGYHSYWLLKEPYAPEEIEARNKGIEHHLRQKLKAVDSCHGSNHILRIPGSWNQKEEHPAPIQVVIVEDAWRPERRYRLDELPLSEKGQESRTGKGKTKKATVPKQATRKRATGVRFSQTDPRYTQELLSLVHNMPSHVKRLLIEGEPASWLEDQSRSGVFFAAVQGLIAYGWEDAQIEALFRSDLPEFAMVQYWQGKRRSNHNYLNECFKKLRRDEDFKGHILPRLVDRRYREEILGRKYESVDATPHSYLTETDTPDLRRLATLAQELYDGARSGAYLAPLPIGAGKTTNFLRPFASYIAKQSPHRGLIIAVERMAQALEHAAWINQHVGHEVAFGLVAHHPAACARAAEGLPYDRRQCQQYHQDYEARESQYPILILTHAMLFRRGVGTYKKWEGGERVMVIYDEKPGLYWHTGIITQRDLGQLKQVYHSAIERAKSLLNTKSHGQAGHLSITPEEEEQLFTICLPKEEEESSQDDEQNMVQDPNGTLRSLYALAKSGGIVIKDGDGGQLLVSHRFPLPDTPTLILDATGDIDPAYPADIPILQTAPDEGLDGERPATIDLVTFNETFTKSKLRKPESDYEETLRVHLQQIVADPMVQDAPVYILCAKANEDRLKTVLQDTLPSDYERCIINHYGNTKGSNAMREAGAIVLTSVQFKPIGLYRTLARLAGRGDETAETQLIQRESKQIFMDKDLEEIKVADQLVTLVQEIGRTRIREGKDITVYLPWSNEEGVLALQSLLSQQFRAKVRRRVLKSPTDRKGRLIEHLKRLATGRPGEQVSKHKITAVIEGTTQKLTKLLKEREIEKLLWGLNITNENKHLAMPKQLETEERLRQAMEACRQREIQPFLKEAADMDGDRVRNAVDCSPSHEFSIDSGLRHSVNFIPADI